MAKKTAKKTASIVALVNKRMAQRAAKSDGLGNLAKRLTPIKKFGFEVKLTTGKNVGITISGENWPYELRRIIRNGTKFDFSHTIKGNAKRNLTADKVEEIVVEATARAAQKVVRKNAG